MLHGKIKLMDNIIYKENEDILILGGGTGDILEYMPINRLGNIHLTDITECLMNVARQRVIKNKWSNVSVFNLDASNFISNKKYDKIIITYTLTMIPNWENTLKNIYVLRWYLYSDFIDESNYFKFMLKYI